jgi:hypothetical protein
MLHNSYSGGLEDLPRHGCRDDPGPRSLARTYTGIPDRQLRMECLRRSELHPVSVSVSARYPDSVLYYTVLSLCTCICTCIGHGEYKRDSTRRWFAVRMHDADCSSLALMPFERCCAHRVQIACLCYHATYFSHVAPATLLQGGGQALRQGLLQLGIGFGFFFSINQTITWTRTSRIAIPRQ